MRVCESTDDLQEVFNDRHDAEAPEGHSASTSFWAGACYGLRAGLRIQKGPIEMPEISDTRPPTKENP